MTMSRSNTTTMVQMIWTTIMMCCMMMMMQHDTTTMFVMSQVTSLNVTDLSTIGYRIIYNSGSLSITEYCTAADIITIDDTLYTTAGFDVDDDDSVPDDDDDRRNQRQLKGSVAKEADEEDMNHRSLQTKSVNCARVCRGYAAGTCRLVYKSCKNYRRRERRDRRQLEEDDDDESDAVFVDTAGEVSDVNFVNLEAINQCESLQEAALTALSGLVAGSSVTPLCETLLNEPVEFKCVIME